MSLKTRIALAVWCIVSLIIPISAKADQSHGPKNGYLLIGGSIGDPYRFIAMAGGSKARIVYIPTANIAKAGVVAKPGVGQDFCILAAKLTGAQCTVLHTDNPHLANSKDFVAPLRDATGVWITGGETWRLAEAYAGTRLLAELFHVLDRGGVVAGNSAGAAIQASFLVRGSSEPGREKIVIAPERQKGFGFFTNTAIDVHVSGAGRENDLSAVMQARPGILGLGLDDAATITVHGDMLTVNGPGRVAVWDEADHDGKGYYYLEGGDTLNTASRVADILPRNAPQENKKPAISEALAQRIRSNTPMPDSGVMLRRYIDELQTARLDSTRMDDLAYLPKKMRRSLLKLNFSAFGALQSVIFKNVSPEGSDVYEVKFENVTASWRVRVTPDGKMEGVDYRKFHKLTDLLH